MLGSNISANIEASRKDLLDLGLRNPLLNHRLSRARGVEIVGELPAEVFRIIVRDRKPMRFKATLEDSENPSAESDPSKLLTQPGEEPSPKKASSRHTDIYLQTNSTPEKLQSRLRKTENDARTFIEEQGTNTLYLALGMLNWFESDASQERRKAPLLLVPVSLERSNVWERFSLEYTEDDLGENLSLATKMRLEFGVLLPQVSSQEDLDVDSYFDTVEEAIRSQKRWSVDRSAVVLSFFSFSKFLMYKDLDEDEWPIGDKPSDHAVMQALLGEGSAAGSPQISEEEQLDRHLAPAEVNQVVNADSSQVLALLDVKNGNNLVIQGPPGTGKSQTITNVIAEAIGHGKTVLFVSEKMAALEVVKRRLDEAGLGDACLELHSHKTNKKGVLQELARTLQLGKPMLNEVEDDIRALSDARHRLNQYCEAINTTIAESGCTPYQAIGELVHQGEEGASSPRLDYDAMRQWTGGEFRTRQRIVEELQAMLKQMGVPSENPFYGITRTVLLPTEQIRLNDSLLNAKQITSGLRESVTDLASSLKLLPAHARSDAEILCRAGRRAAHAPRLDGVVLRADEWRTRKEDLRALLAAGTKHSEVRTRYKDRLIPEAQTSP